MRHAPIAFLGLLVFTWLGFKFYPGHSYLRGATQLYVPILERLASPGYLSRDLVATHPNVTYTVYDEATLFLRQALRVDFAAALGAQQILFRFAWAAGVFLIARATGLNRLWSVVLSASVSLGAVLPGCSTALLDPEPVPRAFSLGLTFFALGLIADEKPLLAGLAAGTGLIYDARVAAPFWIILLLAFALDRRLRYLVRPSLPILTVFALLLANLAQLQPGAAENQQLLERITPYAAMIQQTRTPWVWVSQWAPEEIWHYLAILMIGLLASSQIWPKLNRQMRWMFICLPVAGVLSVPLSYVLLERMRWAIIPQIEPAKSLAFTVAICVIACGLAGLMAARRARVWEAVAWFALVFLVQIDVRILDALRLTNVSSLSKLAIALLLGGAFALIAAKSASGPWQCSALLIPCVAMLVLPFAPRFHAGDDPQTRQIPAALSEVAAWAAANTWAGSVFAFPDAAKSTQPSVFRASAQRALWVDWESGAQILYTPSLTEIWWARWQEMMEPPFSPSHLQSLLSLPVDYYVLRRLDALAAGEDHHYSGIPAVFSNEEFVVYEAEELRNAPGKLRFAAERPGG
ncbi:MAG: hypothetical protein JO270_20520 [Acidobacteriaceae bacterium]|nr:hypothetical protein [Acidobacteriaceae bacterium]